MATLHIKVRFEVPPKLEDVRKKVHERTGLKVALGIDSIDPGHEWPELGLIREAGSLECDEAGDSDLGADLRTNYTPMIRAIRACPKPVIAALNGTAAGAGLSLALACDIRLAATGTPLIVVFVRVGLVPDAGSLFFLTRMLGLSKATELAITGDPLSAEDAHRLGLVAAVVPPDQLMTAAMERARRLAAGPRQTYALIKRGMERALDLDLEQTLELESQLQALAAKTPDAQEAIRAFLEKRKPVFGR